MRSSGRMCLLLGLRLLLLLVQVCRLLGKRGVRLSRRLSYRIVHLRLWWHSTRNGARDRGVKIEGVCGLHKEVLVAECVLTAHPTAGIKLQ